MFRFLVRRLFVAIPTLLLLSFSVFLLLEFTPGDVTTAVLDDSVTAEQQEALREEAGLNQTLFERYLYYLTDLAQGDMGTSFRSGLSVSREIGIRLPYTLVLIGTALVIGVTIGVTLGAGAAVYQNSVLDYAVNLLVSLSMAIPTFWLALLLVNLFALQLGWLPVFGSESAGHLVLPAFCTAFAIIPGIARLTRACLIEVLHANFVLTARGRGLRQLTVILRHVSPVVAITIITYTGVQTVRMVGIAAVIETIFSWPGLGAMAISAAFDRDPALVQGTTLTIAVMTFVVLFVVDLLVLQLDPRISEKAV